MSIYSHRYKIPLLISLVISLAIIVFSYESYWLTAVFAFVGGILGFLFIDLDFILHSYIIDSAAASSMKVKELVRYRSIKGYLAYVSENELEFHQTPIRSVLFQVMLLVFSFYAVTVNAPLFLQSFVLSMFATILYMQIMEYNKTKTLKRWFWIYNGQLTQGLYVAYMSFMTFFFLLIFAFV